MVLSMLTVAACTAAAASVSHAEPAGDAAVCNATMRSGWSIGAGIFTQLPCRSRGAARADVPAAIGAADCIAECCATCGSTDGCVAFVVHGSCYLKGDLNGSHPKPGNTAGILGGGAFPPGPPPPPPPPPTPQPLPTPSPPPGWPRWETVESSPVPVINRTQAAAHGILAGFETGQYQRIGDTFYYTANELGLCEPTVWDKATRAGLWSAPNSTGPWSRVTTLRNGSHMWSLCKNTATPYPGSEDNLNYVTWAPTLVRAPSSVNASAGEVWNLFYSSKQDRAGDKDKPGGIEFNGISWAVSTTDSIAGPYVDVVAAGADGVVVNDSHSFSAWRLRNGSYAGFRNNVRGAPSFSAGLIVPVADGGRTPGGVWRNAGPNIAVQDGGGEGLRWAPENPVVMQSADGRWYYSVYDALRQLPADAPAGSRGATDGFPGICSSQDKCDRIGIAWSADGVTWNDSELLAVQTGGAHPCGQIRTPLGLAPEPERCRGCYSVLWTGITGSFRPVCHAIIRNVNEE